MVKILTEEKDAFGHCLYDHQKGQETYQIVERDDGHIDVVPADRYFAEFEDWPKHQREAMEYVEGRVLDIGCGAGKHALYLQNQDYQVTGIDISPLAVEVSEKRGLKDARIMDIKKVDEHFDDIDTVLMLGNNFGLFGGKDRAELLLKKLKNATSEDCTIIAESMDPHETEKDYHLEYHKKNLQKGRLPGRLVIRSRNKKYATPWFDYLLVSQKEMREVLENTDWDVKKTIDGEGRYICLIEKGKKDNYV